MDISGAAEIPVTKLFGRSPSGLNATGESDLQNYYDMIAEKQEAVLRPILNKVLPPFIISTIGSLPEDFDFDFDPVAEPSDKERADLAKCGTDNVVAAYNAGLISQRTALQELKQQSERTGVWTNITDEDIERASDTVEQPGEMGGMFGGEESLETQAPVSVRQGVGDNKPDANGAEHDNKGRFTGNRMASAFAEAAQKIDLQSGENDVNMYVSRALSRKAVLGALPKTIDIGNDIQLRNKGYKISANSKVTKIYGFAVGDEIAILPKLQKKFPNASSDKWVKCSSNAMVTDESGNEFESEIHFYYNEDIGAYEYKFPTRLVKEWGL